MPMALEYSTASVCICVDPGAMPSWRTFRSNSSYGHSAKQDSVPSLHQPARYCTQSALCFLGSLLNASTSRAELELGLALMHVPGSNASISSLREKSKHVCVCPCSCYDSSLLGQSRLRSRRFRGRDVRLDRLVLHRCGLANVGRIRPLPPKRSETLLKSSQTWFCWFEASH